MPSGIPARPAYLEYDYDRLSSALDKSADLNSRVTLVELFTALTKWPSILTPESRRTLTRMAAWHPKDDIHKFLFQERPDLYSTRYANTHRLLFDEEWRDRVKFYPDRRLLCGERVGLDGKTKKAEVKDDEENDGEGKEGGEVTKDSDESTIVVSDSRSRRRKRARSSGEPDTTNATPTSRRRLENGVAGNVGSPSALTSPAKDADGVRSERKAPSRDNKEVADGSDEEGTEIEKDERQGSCLRGGGDNAMNEDDNVDGDTEMENANVDESTPASNSNGESGGIRSRVIKTGIHRDVTHLLHLIRKSWMKKRAALAANPTFLDQRIDASQSNTYGSFVSAPAQSRANSDSSGWSETTSNEPWETHDNPSFHATASQPPQTRDNANVGASTTQDDRNDSLASIAEISAAASTAITPPRGLISTLRVTPPQPIPPLYPPPTLQVPPEPQLPPTLQPRPDPITPATMMPISFAGRRLINGDPPASVAAPNIIPPAPPNTIPRNLSFYLNYLSHYPKIKVTTSISPALHALAAQYPYASMLAGPAISNCYLRPDGRVQTVNYFAPSQAAATAEVFLRTGQLWKPWRPLSGPQELPLDEEARLHEWVGKWNDDGRGNEWFVFDWSLRGRWVG